MIDRLRDPEGELREWGKILPWVNPLRCHRAVSLLELAGPTDNGEGHTFLKVAEPDHP
jgi:hypothetical protein